uniref:Helicase ATP-binding domain-containing protein n=1 Tax=viral metagenome TaxID=1070528 RepID=A0A6C0DJE6_9ZZZZ
MEQFKGKWTKQSDSSERNKLLEEFKTYTAPIKAQTIKALGQDQREIDGSLYPEITDETFLKKLLKKREFRETMQAKITNQTLEENVCDVDEFEYTSAQKFVSQFMSPNTPYNGMLLYHGVGVGKTCSAILAAESFLQLSPKNKVYILAPPAIQAGFYRTIFDPSRITFGKDDQPNSHEGCTGNRYLDLTQMLFERDKREIELRVNRLINKRYAIMGYVAFRNMVLNILSQIPSSLNPERKQQQKIILLQRALSGAFLIVDEAHNLRDVSDSADDEGDQVDDIGDKSDASAGKKLVPMLREVLKTCEGNKLMLMSATPMYNSYKEIVSLLNLLLLVDKSEDLLKESDIIFEQGANGEQLSKASEDRLIEVANGHVSFMRGENPKAFPARMDPAPEVRISEWALTEPNGSKQIPGPQKNDVLRLPLVKCNLEGETLAVMKAMTERLVASKGVGIRTIDTLLQAGNCIFPGDDLDGRVGSEGFQAWFTGKAVASSFEGTRLSTLPQYIPTDPDEDYSWMVASDDALGRASPKFNNVLKTIRKATGISFVYSRFVENGAVIFCLLLEANGYTPWGRSAPLFSKGSLQGKRQCCKCEKKEEGHPVFSQGQPESRENHKFSPAFYALLTASDVSTMEKQSLPLSPNNTAVINAARHIDNKDGYKIKVVVGSQVAGEGLDLRYLREVHILEGWFHLSKEEQIVGRGIRYCSHNALPRQKRNCTINLYVNVFPPEMNKETIDQYSYRTAMNKAVRMGNVSRALKRGAADCNLNRDAILVSGLSNVEMLDSQGQPRTVDLNDRDYTPTCDWIRCSYECKPSLNLSDKKEMPDDNGTYDMFAARFAEQMMIQKLRTAFKDQPWHHLTNLEKKFPDIPKATLTSLLLRVVNNPSIVFENGNLQGHIVFRNNLFLFQPNKIHNEGIPISFRYGRYPMKRDSYMPEFTALPSAKTTIAKTAVGQKTPVSSSVELAKKTWLEAMKWLDIWTKEGYVIEENIPSSLTDALYAYLEGDSKKRENIETRLKKLQWWGIALTRKVIKNEDGSYKILPFVVPGGLNDLKRAAKEFIWDSFLNGPEQVALLEQSVSMAPEGGSEQFRIEGSITVSRFMDIETKAPVYLCAGSTPCPPSVLKIFNESKTDPVVLAKANSKVSANPYGFMVVWENAIMFKTNDAKNEEGKPPGGGAACSIVSNVKGHRMKLVELGKTLARFHEGNTFELTEDLLASGPRKLTGAPSFCALMEIVLRWMDIRREKYGNLRYFYRPLSSFYSKHKSKK